MNNLITNFPQILEFAKSANLPLEKKRAIIREYLQTKILTIIYQQPLAKKLSFVGGTSLRLLRNLNRFSEDLDFDNLGLKQAELNQLISLVNHQLNQENIKTELVGNKKTDKTFWQLRFPDLLLPLKITSDPREKLMIKIDYSSFWEGQKPQTVLLNHFGFLTYILTNPLDQILIQKLAAYVNRQTIQPRDIYDIVWLYSQNAKPDQEFLSKNRLRGLIRLAKTRLSHHPINQILKRKLVPFLFEANSVNQLDLFPIVLHQL